MKEIIRQQNSRPFLAKIFPASLLGVSAGIYKEALVDELRIFRTQMGRTLDHKMVAVAWDAFFGYRPIAKIVTVTVLSSSVLNIH
jgi:hypothetical protein